MPGAQPATAEAVAAAVNGARCQRVPASDRWPGIGEEVFQRRAAATPPPRSMAVTEPLIVSGSVAAGDQALGRGEDRVVYGWDVDLGAELRPDGGRQRFQQAMRCLAGCLLYTSPSPRDCS